MTRQPRVSVIMPTYNDDPLHLQAAIDSVLCQSHQGVELIIIDDGSSNPETRDFISRLSDPHIVALYQENAGPGAARNTGVRASRGEFILPLDADDLIAPDYIERASSVLADRADVSLVYGDAEYFGTVEGPMPLPPYSQESQLVRNSIFNSAMYRRKDFDSVGGYNERMRAGLEDHEFWLRLCRRFGPPHRLSGIVYYYRLKKHSRNSSVYADRAALVASRAEMFQANVEAYAEYPEALFWEMEELRNELVEYQKRFAVMSKAYERFTPFRHFINLISRLIERIAGIMASRKGDK